MKQRLVTTTILSALIEAVVIGSKINGSKLIYATIGSKNTKPINSMIITTGDAIQVEHNNPIDSQEVPPLAAKWRNF